MARTEHALAEPLAQDLSGLDLVALLVDGIRVAEHTCVVALGIAIDGTKVPLALAEGATENATVVTEVLVGLRDRGLEVTRPILVVIDGAKALRRAVTEVFDHPVIQRCQLHKLRNVSDRLPDAVASTVAKRMRARLPPCRPADRPGRVGGAGPGAGPLPPGRGRQPAGGAGRDPHHHPVWRAADAGPNVAVPTNSIESMIEICRDHATNVKISAGRTARWCCAGSPRAWVRPATQFRRVNGYLHLAALRVALDQTIAAVTPTKEDAA